MKYRRGKLLGLMLTLALVIGLLPVMSLTAYATESTYTITIPSTLEVYDSGWNELEGGITASGTLASGKQLVITASSDNGFKFVHQTDNTQTVSYDFCASSTDLTPITEWTFDSLSTDSITQTAGINVEDITYKLGGTYTETVTFTAEIVDATIDLSTLTAYEAQDGDILTGTAGADAHITIADEATITLKDATITSINTSNKWAGITCEGDATIILSGNNKVKGGHMYYPGIHIASGSTLTIQGSGSLTVSSNGIGAGIGGGYNGIHCGNIVIEGGTISATGGNDGAGIGGASRSSCGNITISGGTITAKGGSYAAGIGGGHQTTCGNITISGGTITATGGDYAAGIGGGSETPCGDITITTDVTSVTATKGSDAPNSIGAGRDSSCGTVTIGGTTGQRTESTYTYTPSN